MADINRMTHKLQEGLQQASTIAARRNHQGIDVEHLLAALLDQEGGLASNLLDVAGVSPRSLRERIERELDKRPKVTGPAAGPSQTYVTQRLNQTLTDAEKEMAALKEDRK